MRQHHHRKTPTQGGDGDSSAFDPGQSDETAALLRAYRDLRDHAEAAQANRDALALLNIDHADPRHLYGQDRTSQNRWHQLDAAMWQLRRQRDAAWHAYAQCPHGRRTPPR